MYILSRWNTFRHENKVPECGCPNIGRKIYSCCSKFLKNHIEKNRISAFSSGNSYLDKTETGQWSCYIALTLD